MNVDQAIHFIICLLRQTSQCHMLLPHPSSENHSSILKKCRWCVVGVISFSLTLVSNLGPGRRHLPVYDLLHVSSVACSSSAASDEPRNIVLAITPGPYELWARPLKACCRTHTQLWWTLKVWRRRPLQGEEWVALGKRKRVRRSVRRKKRSTKLEI